MRYFKNAWSFIRPTSDLEAHQDTIEAYFREHPATTIPQAVKRIEELTRIKRSPTQVGIFLKKLGLKRLKTSAIPAKCDVEQQASFKNELEPRLEQAKAGQRTIFFVDAAHFVLGAYLGWLWCFARVVVHAPSGRQRLNVLGALHAITHQLITVTNDSYINAASVCELLEKIALLGLYTPITVVMDNARYQRCRLVLERAAHLGIEVLFLPTYSPNLNLIERFGDWSEKSACMRTITSTLSCSNGDPELFG